jgi:hypothetical protein
LEEQLAAGRSYEAVGRELGRHASTVAYWARKHGLTSAHAPRHAARGPIERELLAEIVACRLSIRDMADLFDRSPTSMRHWLIKHGITPPSSARREAGRRATSSHPDLPCPIHGMTRHVPRGDASYRCARCRSDQVGERRRRVKRQLVAEAGGKCALCGYDRCVAALQFHHVDRGAKGFAIGSHGVARAIAKARKEAAKCVLLCANCHAEVESGFAQLPLRSADRQVYPG